MEELRLGRVILIAMAVVVGIGAARLIFGFIGMFAAVIVKWWLDPRR